MALKEILKDITPNFCLEIYRFLKSRFFAKIAYGNVSYSQNGEDILLEAIFYKQQKGFYVDVGAHHPIKYSNTFLLYKRGWRGINIDAMPGSMKTFAKYRKGDINIECGVGSRGGGA